MLTDEPGLQLVGADDLAHEEIVGAVVARLGRLTRHRPALLENDLVGVQQSPELDGALQLVDVRGRIEGARVTDLDLEARFVGRDLRVERLQVAVLGGTVTASGDIPLLDKSGGVSRFAFELKDVDLAQFIDRELRASADSPALLVSLDGEFGAPRWFSPERRHQREIISICDGFAVSLYISADKRCVRFLGTPDEVCNRLIYNGLLVSLCRGLRRSCSR